ncbi:Hsp20/alpha crystallin family protein [Ramlibacter sp. AW1]|uniref:Hsp20/alpha crystallin family protein n=1 Tax=Ramlibacter aurantiacus TaxID=2801330 RepID=A0A937D368_9BURK|nr:Hsp20/alpha crystallin family protein [Ramlibacter aurantiacus]MBL0419002.1 Hsp20/alpha crystallin family protein [Ramlibacter aurantiacus]
MSNLRLIDPVFGDNLESAWRRFFPPGLLDKEAEALRMRLDVTENDKAYVVKADIPGVKKEDIDVQVDGNVVSIRAETRSEKETRGDGDRVLRSERSYGTISRSFSLGQDVDASQVQARYADGVLSLELPKKSPADSRRIAIQ